MWTIILTTLFWHPAPYADRGAAASVSVVTLGSYSDAQTCNLVAKQLIKYESVSSKQEHVVLTQAKCVQVEMQPTPSKGAK